MTLNVAESTMAAMIDSKRCRFCGTEKELSDFGRNRRTADGLSIKCKECTSAYAKARYETHREEILQKNARWREANSEQVKAQQKEYNARPGRREQQLARLAKWIAENPARSQAQRNDWKLAKRRADPLYDRLQGGARRARRWNAPIEQFTSADLVDYWQTQGISPDHCYYTGEPLEEGWHTDHKTPLCRGGAHSVENIVPCSASANSSKNDKTEEEFRMG